MTRWEYTFYISSVNSVGIKDIPSVEDLWDGNGYRISGEKTKMKTKNENEEDIVNSFGQRGWELISITPIAFLVNRDDLGKTTELMLTFKKRLE